MKGNPLLNIGYLKFLLKENNLVLKKNRGQNFLVDGNILRKIIREADLRPNDRVLEIGAGLGTLTRELCRRAGNVIAVEWDRGLTELLFKQTAECNNLQVIQGDILRMDFSSLLENTGSKIPQFDMEDKGRRGNSTGKFKVVSNLPYSICSPVLIKLLESKIGIQTMVCMVQEELGSRIVSKPGKKSYGILSLLAQMHSRPRIAFKVSRNCFFPLPRVDSAVINFQMLEGAAYPVKDIKLWKALVKAAFARRRKMLKNTLAQDDKVNYTSDQIIRGCSRANLDPNLRAEQLSVEDFARLADALFNLNYSSRIRVEGDFMNNRSD